MENAILLSLVVVLALLSIESVGNHTKGIFGRVGDRLDGTATEHAGQFDRLSDDDDLSHPIKLAQSQNFVRWVRILVLVTIALLATCAWIVRRRKPTENTTQRSLDVSAQFALINVFEKRHQILHRLSANLQSLFDGKLEVRHLMTRNPATIKPSQSIKIAFDLMDDNRVSHLLVCDEDGILVGLVSKHYLRRTSATTITEAMATDPLFVAPNALLNPTVTMMINHHVSCIAVVEEGRAVGTLTTTDVQLTLQCALQLLVTATSDDECEDSLPVPSTEIQPVAELDSATFARG